MHPKSFVDPPSEFAPKREWREFLAEMLLADQTDPAVIDAIKLAREILADDSRGTGEDFG